MSYVYRKLLILVDHGGDPRRHGDDNGRGVHERRRLRFRHPADHAPDTSHGAHHTQPPSVPATRGDLLPTQKALWRVLALLQDAH